MPEPHAQQREQREQRDERQVLRAASSVVSPSSAPGASQRHTRPPSDAHRNASIAAGSQNSATGSASIRPVFSMNAG